jgi:NAD(P)H-hydrate epimerase
MATGGSGDILTGLITALLCQHLEPFAAAQLGAHLHGLAGDMAAKEKGETSLIARDLVEFIPWAFREYSRC